MYSCPLGALSSSNAPIVPPAPTLLPTLPPLLRCSTTKRRAVQAFYDTPAATGTERTSARTYAPSCRTDLSRTPVQRRVARCSPPARRSPVSRLAGAGAGRVPQPHAPCIACCSTAGSGAGSQVRGASREARAPASLASGLPARRAHRAPAAGGSAVRASYLGGHGWSGVCVGLRLRLWTHSARTWRPCTHDASEGVRPRPSHCGRSSPGRAPESRSAHAPPTHPPAELIVHAAAEAEASGVRAEAAIGVCRARSVLWHFATPGLAPGNASVQGRVLRGGTARSCSVLMSPLRPRFNSIGRMRMPSCTFRADLLLLVLRVGRRPAIPHPPSFVFVLCTSHPHPPSLPADTENHAGVESHAPRHPRASRPQTFAHWMI